ncbi:MAG: MlaD family protein [Pseudomonadota bacterium]
MTQPRDSNGGPTAQPRTSGRSNRISLIWLVPLAALVISFWLSWQHYASLGTLITIRFDSAEGLEAGTSTVRFRSVEVGKVEEMHLDSTLQQVIVTVRINKASRSVLNESTRFWIERPRIGPGGVSGLGTIFSGAYIAMSTSADKSLAYRNTFTGLEDPPLTATDEPGLHLLLTSTAGASLTAGAPVLYKQFEVGKIESRRLIDDGQTTAYGVFINEPYDRFVDSNTRFWELGAFKMGFGAQGMTLEVEPISVLINGGIAFDTPRRLKAGTPVEDDTTFELYPNREAAHLDLTTIGSAFGYVLHFNESLRGLGIGSPVEYRGVQVGHVADITIENDTETGKLTAPVLIFLNPNQLSNDSDKQRIHTLLDNAIAQGLRARLQVSSWLTGQLFIELVMVDDAQYASINPGDPYPEFPTVASPSGEIMDSFSRVLTKIEQLPLEELLSSADMLLHDIDSLVRDPADDELGDQPQKRREQLANAPLQSLLGKVNHALDGLNPILHASETQALPEKLSNSIRKLNDTLKSVKQLLEGDKARSPLYYELSTMLKELTRAARSLGRLSETLDEKPNALIFGND